MVRHCITRPMKTARMLSRLHIAIGISSALLILCQYRLIKTLFLPVARDNDAAEAAEASSAVSAIVEAYRDIVKNGVDRQITTWNNIVGLASDNYTIRERTSDVDAPGNIPAVRSGARGRAQKQKSFGTTTDDIVWDRESDISTYFDELMSKCSLSNFTYHGCFGYLHSLAAGPRCTMSLDSRYTCDGDEHGGGGVTQTQSVEAIIRDHLKKDTVNVIIIGAGPVGLLLANSLSQLGGVRPKGARDKMRIRTLVFENRVVKSGPPGRKRLYTRDWQTQLRRKHFEGGVVDPRISDFFRLVFEGSKYVTLPVYALETLLLLSCRDRGARFVYGNYGDHADALADVRNAIVFDATGHRLDLVARDGDDPYDEGRGSPHRLALTTADANIAHASGETAEFVEFLASRNATVSVAERETAGGLIKYPINRANGNPFQIHYLKMYKLWSRPTDKAFQKLWRNRGGRNAEVWNASFNTRENLFCRDACNVTKWKSMCLVARWYDWDQNPPRKDIMAALREIPLEDALFATSVSFLSLLPSQANAFANLHEGKRGIEIPLRDLNLEGLLAHPDFQTNGIDMWLRSVGMYASNRVDPIFALVAYRPFIYPDPVIPSRSFSLPLARLGAPVLRIGDSLFKGDPNSANGLSNHVKAISQFSRRLGNLTWIPRIG